ncbi:MAG: propanediol utilization protein, partial [Pseudomonadota bacterium]
LWAPRQAESLECFDTAPRFDVVGAVMAPPQRTEPADLRFPDVSDLVSAWRTADSPERAGLAAESATRTLHLRQGQAGAVLAQTMARLARDTGALGWSIAHTGGLAALLFARGEVDLDQKAQAFRKMGARHVVRFGL